MTEALSLQSSSKQKGFNCLAELFIGLTEQLRPPERLTVAEAAEKYRHLNNPGSYVGPWHNSEVPYMVEPMNELTSRTQSGVVFVGPAQSAKTDALILNWLLYDVKVDPMDMAIFSPTMSAAKDFSARRVDRMHRFSPEIGKLLLKERDSDNTYDKHYVNGTMLSLGWPSVSQFAGRPIGRIALTDYDRMDDDIEGDGAPYDLASKRTTTFGSFAMTLAESSPSRALENPNWVANSPHEAPPCKGIIALYNRGDKRRLYWPCPHCGEFFEGNFKHLAFEKLANIVDSSETVRMVCPACDGIIFSNDRKEMLRLSVWLKDGQTIDRDRTIHGGDPRSPIASFWLKGVAARFVSWSGLVVLYLNAQREYDTTGSEAALQKFSNNDLGEPYEPPKNDDDRLPEVLKSRAERLPEREIPPGVRFTVSTIDVQKNMFVVQTFGISPGEPFDMVLIDRFNIVKSNRVDADGDIQWVKPSTYSEDWDLLVGQVLKAKYPLSDGSGRYMQTRAVGCDSGGREGVTTQAYNFWRKLRGEGNSGRFHLLKGDPATLNGVGTPRARVTFPDSSRRDKLSGARGDVPVLMLNSNLLKDTLRGRLMSVAPGKGMFRFPDWLGDNFFTEMCAEVRTPKGWEAASRRRNEAWDLSYYAIGLCVSEYIKVERIDWMRPPGWAAEWDSNDLVTKDAVQERFAQVKPKVYDLSKLGAALA